VGSGTRASRQDLGADSEVARVRRVLIVDDNVDAGDSMVALVGAWGHTAKVARDAAGPQSGARDALALDCTRRATHRLVGSYHLSLDPLSSGQEHHSSAAVDDVRTPATRLSGGRRSGALCRPPVRHPGTRLASLSVRGLWTVLGRGFGSVSAVPVARRLARRVPDPWHGLTHPLRKVPLRNPRSAAFALCPILPDNLYPMWRKLA